MLVPQSPAKTGIGLVFEDEEGVTPESAPETSPEPDPAEVSPPPDAPPAEAAPEPDKPAESPAPDKDSWQAFLDPNDPKSSELVEWAKQTFGTPARFLQNARHDNSLVGGQGRQITSLQQQLDALQRQVQTQTPRQPEPSPVESNGRLAELKRAYAEHYGLDDTAAEQAARTELRRQHEEAARQSAVESETANQRAKMAWLSHQIRDTEFDAQSPEVREIYLSNPHVRAFENAGMVEEAIDLLHTLWSAKRGARVAEPPPDPPPTPKPRPPAGVASVSAVPSRPSSTPRSAPKSQGNEVDGVPVPEDWRRYYEAARGALDGIHKDFAGWVRHRRKEGKTR